MDHTIHGLIKKRGEIAGQHKVAMKTADTLKADLDAVDRALVLCGYEDHPKGIAPRTKYKQLFGRNELKLTVLTREEAFHHVRVLAVVVVNLGVVHAVNIPTHAQSGA